MPQRPARARNLLAYGITLSVALHLIVLPFAYPGPTIAKDTIVDYFGDHAPPIPVPPRATPTPRPRPHVAPPMRTHAAAPVRRTMHIVSFRQESAPRGGELGRPNAVAAGGPAALPDDVAASAQPEAAIAPVVETTTPRPTPSPVACARPAVAAATVRAAEPEMPALAQQQGIRGTVDIVVALDAASRIVEVSVQSSPSKLLDAPALAAARASQFRTEIRDCAPIAARYLFRVDFTAE